MFEIDDPRRLAARRKMARRGVPVIHEDNHVLIVSKPAGLLSQGDRSGKTSLVEVVEEYRREAENKPGRAFVGLVHRLDRNVSGCVVIARTSKAAARLSALFRDRSEELRKTYLAWVDRPAKTEGARLEHRLRREGGVTREAGAGDTDGKTAILDYVVEARSHRASRFRVRLGTGLAHQIRAQLYLAGHPIIGDTKYQGPPGKRPGLHAVGIAFPHPTKDVRVEVAAPIPEDLLKLDERLALVPSVGEGIVPI